MLAKREPNPSSSSEEDAALVDSAGRRSLLIASLSGATGLGMIAAGWALVRWPAAIITSIDRVFRAIGGPPASLDEVARQSRDAAGAAGSTSGDARP